MEELALYAAGFVVLAGLVIAAVIVVGYLLLWAAGITIGVGALSGLALGLKAPHIYLSHLWRRLS